MPQPLARALAEVTFLAQLRPDELVRAAQHFTRHPLGAGSHLDLDPATPTYVLVISGRVQLTTAPLAGQPVQTVELLQGDAFGDVQLACCVAQRATLLASEDSVLALLETKGFQQLLATFPVIALPLVEAVAQELRFKDALIRELGELEALDLPSRNLEGALSVRRRALRRRGTRVVRRAASAVYRQVIIARGHEPTFWMLIGFVSALAGARATVGGILHYHLEHQLFATMQQPGDPNPMHLHHFNYGLLLVITAGLGTFLPRTRQLARTLPALFGMGAALIFDEWALIWNLDPNYYQALSYTAAAAAFAALLQLTMFRRFWTGWARRLAARFAP